MQLKNFKEENGKYNIKEIVEWSAYILLLFGIVYLAPKTLSYFLKTPYPLASITSGSMAPLLQRGDLVLIKGVSEKDQISVGDVIVYKNDRGFIIHRVVRKNEEDVITKGDANTIVDIPVKYEEVVGKALVVNEKPFKIPLLGTLSLIFNNEKE